MTDVKVIVISAVILLFSVIVALTAYAINDRNLMAKNIETAVAKGIDPLSVRCSYVKGEDIICVAYASSHSNINTSASSTTSSKK